VLSSILRYLRCTQTYITLKRGFLSARILEIQPCVVSLRSKLSVGVTFEKLQVEINIDNTSEGGFPGTHSQKTAVYSHSM